MASIILPRSINVEILSAQLTKGLQLLLSGILMLMSAGCSEGGRGLSNVKIGSDGGAAGFIGQELPVSAHISANSAIEHVYIEIRPSSGDGWSFTQRYTDGLAGKKDATFNANIVVPSTAEVDNYRILLRVTDIEGTVSEAKAGFKLTVDSTLPIASDLDVGINTAGNDLHLETELTAPAKIEKVVVEINGDAWEKAFSFAGERMVGRLTHHFHEHVHVEEAPGGTYRVTLTVEDQKGRRAQTEGMFTK